MNVIPLSGGRTSSSLLNASRPPADAPNPTTGQSEDETGKTLLSDSPRSIRAGVSSRRAARDFVVMFTFIAVPIRRTGQQESANYHESLQASNPDAPE